ncbi:TMV resistance protein N-like [Pyrus ussuriensis x Pyrus communis]|uniref:TMV resistance protein N-like n=1 Tax=Pyrus ussuriensis x Pyrus communis TaxID=2448454 RepID=A0A5N5FCI4_9ROSA|nr:TMV resistance protein N-like [Pyrus ussuriensis x Pyrus communis]
MFVWYNAFELIEQSERECSTVFYKLVAEVSVDLCKLDSFPAIPYYFSLMVNMCGICLLYAEDAEKLKSNVMIAEPKGEEESEASRYDRFGT